MSGNIGEPATVLFLNKTPGRSYTLTDFDGDDFFDEVRRHIDINTCEKEETVLSYARVDLMSIIKSKTPEKAIDMLFDLYQNGEGLNNGSQLTTTYETCF